MMLKIYIVEDNLLMATVLKQMLLSMGHCVCGWSDNYTKAVSDLKKMEVDLVITDIMLKGKKTGIDIGSFIKSNLNIPFIYLSSVTASDTIKAALDSLPDTYLFKPATTTSLAEALFNLNNKNNISLNKNATCLSALASNS